MPKSVVWGRGSDFHVGALAAQTAGAQRGQAALVGQLGQRVRLIHELAQGAGAEALLDGRHHGPDVDQSLGGQGGLVLALEGHALADDALHAGEADAELVLQQLAHAAQTAVLLIIFFASLRSCRCSSVSGGLPFGFPLCPGLNQ